MTTKLYHTRNYSGMSLTKTLQ